jgi:hypothetical protein
MTDAQPGLQHIQFGAMRCHACNDANGSGGLMSAGTHGARFFERIEIQHLTPSDKTHVPRRWSKKVQDGDVAQDRGGTEWLFGIGYRADG